jgi:hypothetical protein
MGNEQRFTTTVAAGSGGRVYIALPFDPDMVWGAKERHHVTGTINDRNVRGPLAREDGWRLLLGPAWRRDNGVAPSDPVSVVLAAEGPQRDTLAPDLAAALDAHPEAGAFWDSLATFYRKGYLRWLDGAARRPAVREERVQEWVSLLAASKKSRDE